MHDSTTLRAIIEIKSFFMKLIDDISIPLRQAFARIKIDLLRK